MRKLTKQDFLESNKNQNFYIDIIEEIIYGYCHKLLVVRDVNDSGPMHNHVVDTVLFNISTGVLKIVNEKVAAYFGFEVDDSNVITEDGVMEAFRCYHLNNGKRLQRGNEFFIDVRKEYIGVVDNGGRLKTILISFDETFKQTVPPEVAEYFDLTLCRGVHYLSKEGIAEVLFQVFQYQNGMLE